MSLTPIASSTTPGARNVRVYLNSFSDLYEKLSPKGMTPPSAVDCEQSLLGAMMFDKSSAFRVMQLIGGRSLDTSPFYRDAHSLIYFAMTTLENKSEPVDLLTVRNQLEMDGTLDAVGGASYLVELTSKVVTTVNVESHARTILEKYVARELIRICEEIKLRAFEGEVGTFELLEEAESYLYSLSTEPTQKAARFSTIESVGLNTIKVLDSIGSQPEAGAISFGLSALDEITDGGTRPGDFVILAGRPGQGKTALAERFVRAPQRTSTAIFSLEMSGVQLTTRLLCGEAKVSMERARRGQLGPEEWRRITEAHKVLAASGLHIFDKRHVTPTAIRTAARHLASKLSRTDRPLGRIVLDYIKLPKLPGKRSKNEEIGEMAEGFKDLAGELETDFIALSQITREVEKRKNPRPIESDIAESGDLEEIADIIIFVYRPETYEIHADDTYLTRLGTVSTKDVAEFIVAKQRNGKKGRGYGKFIPSQIRFEDWPPIFPNEPEPQEQILF